MNESRKNRFLKRMREIGVVDLVVQGKEPGCIIQLGVWASGFAGTPASYKNYRYTAIGPPKDTTATMESLDNPPHSNEVQVLERPLSGGWWLEYVDYP